MVVELLGSVRISGPQLSAAWEFLSSSTIGPDVVEIFTGSQFEVPGFNRGPVHVGFVLDDMSLGQVSFRVF
jgi:hypothetical protein